MIDPASIMTCDPNTGRHVASYVVATAAEISAAGMRASQAFAQWRQHSCEQRSTALNAIAGILKHRAGEYAEKEAADTGKSLAAAMSEVQAAIGLWEYAAALARTHAGHGLANSLVRGVALTISEPVGPVGLIVPWNYPLITTSERMPFALAAGCSVVLKPSEIAVGCLAMLVEEIRRAAILPEHTVQVVHGPGKTVGDALCRHPDIAMIAFVGSTVTGRMIESTATAHGKKVSSELGGNNYVLVYADADLAAAARAVIAGGFRNGGQACIAGTHVLVAPQVAEVFAGLLTAELRRSFPADAPENIQAMITPEHRARIAGLIKQGLAEHLVVLDGSNPGGDGQRIGPVIFDQVPVTSGLLQDEIFGPVVTVSRVEEEQMLSVANQSSYGLAGYAWTASAGRAMQVAREFRVGRLWINADPESWLSELPVGGFGASGTGREMGPDALKNYASSRSILIG